MGPPGTGKAWVQPSAGYRPLAWGGSATTSPGGYLKGWVKRGPRWGPLAYEVAPLATLRVTRQGSAASCLHL